MSTRKLLLSFGGLFFLACSTPERAHLGGKTGGAGNPGGAGAAAAGSTGAAGASGLAGAGNTSGIAGDNGAAGTVNGAAGDNSGTAGAATGAAGDNSGTAGAATGAAGDNSGTAGAATGSAGAGAAGAGAAGAGAAGAGAAGAGAAGAGAAGAGAAGAGAAGSGAAGASPTLYNDWCAPVHWTFSANPVAINAMDFMQNVVDNNIASRWSTGMNQAPGEYFQIDFGGTVSLTQVVLDDTNNMGDYPRAYDIGLSALGTTFTTVAMNAANTNVVVTETFGAAQGRYLRINQKGTAASWWSIDELRLMCTVPGYTAGQVDPLDGKSWKATASRSAAADVPANAIDASPTTRWSTGGAMAAGDFFTVDMGGVGMLSAVSYDFGGAADFPMAYKLELSTDCTTYTQVAAMAGVAGVNKIPFARQNARCFKMTQTGTTGTTYWSIYNIAVTP
jgi:hypothetical protein